jgi:hypothetical protein
MSETEKFIRRFSKKLDRVIDLHASACGHEEQLRDALDEQVKLIGELREYLKALNGGGK